MPVKLSNPNQEGIRMEPTPKSLMDDMIREYMNTVHKESTEVLQKQYPGRKFPNGKAFCEAHSAWVSRKEIEQLLDDNDGDGIRIYYGVHDKDTTKDPNDPNNYKGLHNVILVATKSDADHQTYNSKDQLQEGNESNANSILVTFNTGDYSGNAGDLITLCPPNCPK